MRSRWFSIGAALLAAFCIVAVTACGPPPFEEGEVPGSSGGEQPAGGQPEEQEDRPTAEASPTPVSGEGTTRLVAPYITDEYSGLLQDWVADFTTKNPDIDLSLAVMDEVELVEFLDSADQLSDVLIIPADYVHDLHARGLLNTDLAATIYGTFAENWFYPIPDADTALSDGTRIAVPYYAAIQGIWYRKDLFEATGLEPPNTPENLLAAAEALHDPSSPVYGIALPTGAAGDSTAAHHALENLARASGGTAIAADGSVAFDSEDFTAALQLYAELAALGPPAGTSIADARLLFLAEQLAMLLDSTALPQELKNRSTDVKRDEMAQKIGFVAAINDTAGDGSTTYAYSIGIAIGNNADESAARALAAYLLADAYYPYWIPQGWGPAMRGFGMQWRALKGHDWFGYYEAGMPEDLLDGFRKSVRWRHAGDAAAITTSRIYSAELFPAAVTGLVGGELDAAGAAEILQSEAAGLE